MEFKILFRVAYKYLSNDYNQPDFFCDLIAMITSVEETQWWDQDHDPAQKRPEETIKNYIKRGFSKKFARRIIDKLTPENLAEKINLLPSASRTSFANDLLEYDATLTKENIGNKFAEWFVELIRVSAGMLPKEEMVKIKNSEQIAELKKRYGDYLFEEVQGHCPLGCGRLLTKTNDDEGSILHSYEIALIDKNENAELKNLIALCPVCYGNIVLDNSEKRIKELKEIKKVISEHYKSMKLIDEVSLEKGITKVISKIATLKEKDLYASKLDATDVYKKIDPEKYNALFETVDKYVSRYFVKINEIMEQMVYSKVRNLRNGRI